jgi:small nuclear ribonucleoprotein (snRNP)-like protein
MQRIRKLILIEPEGNLPVLKQIETFLRAKSNLKWVFAEIVTDATEFKTKVTSGMFDSILSVTHSEVYQVYCQVIIKDLSKKFDDFSMLHLNDKVTLTSFFSKVKRYQSEKRISYREFETNFNPILENAFECDNETIWVKVNGGPVIIININSITYMRGSGVNKTIIYTLVGKHEVMASQVSLLHYLPEHFTKIHRLYTANLKHILSVDKNNAKLRNGHLVPISSKMKTLLNDVVEYNKRDRLDSSSENM